MLNFCCKSSVHEYIITKSQRELFSPPFDMEKPRLDLLFAVSACQTWEVNWKRSHYYIILLPTTSHLSLDTFNNGNKFSLKYVLICIKLCTMKTP